MSLFIVPQPKKNISTPISKLDFRNRFTLAEKIAVEESTDTIVRVIKKDFEAAEFIVLSDEETIAGVEYYAQAGLITPERANEILTTVPSSKEGI